MCRRPSASTENPRRRSGEGQGPTRLAGPCGSWISWIAFDTGAGRFRLCPARRAGFTPFARFGGGRIAALEGRTRIFGKFYTSLKMGDLLARLREVYEKSYRIEKSFRNDLTGVHRNE